MSWMFYGMSKLTNIDVSHFDTSKVIDMSYMFGGMSNLKTIYIGINWTTSSVTADTKMFLSDYKLVGGSGTTFDANHIDKEYARIDDPANGNPGYLTLKEN